MSRGLGRGCRSAAIANYAALTFPDRTISGSIETGPCALVMFDYPQDSGKKAADVGGHAGSDAAGAEVIRRLRAPQGPVRIDGASQVMVSNSLVGQVSSRGSINIYDRRVPARLQTAGCQSP